MQKDPTEKLWQTTVSTSTGAKPAKVSRLLKLAIAHRHQTVLISLDVRLLPSQWDSDKLCIRNHPVKLLLTTYLDQVKSTVSTRQIR